MFLTKEETRALDSLTKDELAIIRAFPGKACTFGELSALKLLQPAALVSSLWSLHNKGLLVFHRPNPNSLVKSTGTLRLFRDYA